MVSVHMFKTTADAYDESQYRDDIKSGDVLVAGFTVGVLVDAWPVAVKGDPGSFHTLADGSKIDTLDGGKWAESAKVAAELDVTKVTIDVFGKNETFTKESAGATFKELKSFFDERTERNHYSGQDDVSTQKVNSAKFERMLSLQTLLNIPVEVDAPKVLTKNKVRS
jgi:hypothetical protein